MNAKQEVKSLFQGLSTFSNEYILKLALKN
jgi:hypothetical protein